MEFQRNVLARGGPGANYGSGSRAVIRRDGMILTNAHVVGAARTVEVGLADGRTFTGTVLGRDAALDVAVAGGA